MKRTEIKTGEEYLVSTALHWVGGHFKNERVRVLDDGHWADIRSLSGREKQTILLSTGEREINGDYRRTTGAKGKVLVEMLYPKIGEPDGRVRLYDPKYFRATWADWLVIEEREEQRREEARVRRAEAEKERIAIRDALAAEMRTAGIKGTLRADLREVTLSFAEMERVARHLTNLPPMYHLPPREK